MYQISNQSSNELEILLYSLVSRGLTANQVIKAINDSQAEKITLRINSDGGEVFESIALYNYLRGKDVHVIVDGIAASGASVIAMAGQTITMMQGSMMMIHNPLTIMIGNAEELRAEAEILDKLSDNLAGIYASRTGKDKGEILEIMKAESWLSAEECCAEGFADEIDAPASEADIAEEEAQDGKVESVQNSALYQEGVRAERQRLQDLDALNAPGRESIINAAKYETGEYAEDIAVKILMQETKPVTCEVNNMRAVSREDSDIQSIADIINRWRN